MRAHRWRVWYEERGTMRVRLWGKEANVRFLVYFKLFLSSEQNSRDAKFFNYEACPESKDTKVLNMHNIFNLQKRHCEIIACI
jgi:hypothetical protein